MATEKTFFSYSRSDSAFVIKLAKDLRDAGVPIWLDQLDIKAGSRWDSSIETALETAPGMIVVLSAESVKSNNVMDEVSFALESGKTLIPVYLSECTTPFRLRRLQRIDFTGDYQTGLKQLLEVLGHPVNNTSTNTTNAYQDLTQTNVPDTTTSTKHDHAETERKLPEDAKKVNPVSSYTKTDTQPTLPVAGKSFSKKYIVIAASVVVLAVAIWVVMPFNSDPKSEALVNTTDSIQTTQSTTDSLQKTGIPDNQVISIGDKELGGIIFYIDETGHHGFIAAPEDYDVKSVSTGADFCNELKTELSNYKSGGFTDWRLPTIEELRLLYDNRNSVPGLNLNAVPDINNRIGLYTPAPDETCQAVAKGFRSGGELYQEISHGHSFRLIRSF